MPSTESPDDTTASTARTYLVWSLVATVLCFLPVGLVALYFGLRVNQANADGRTEDANRSSLVARRWLVATAIIGVVIYAASAMVLAALGAFSR
jgi:heme/copper-type cytochrome/quinol oxidase subunit 2